MGYTHYWTFNSKAGKAADLEARYQQAILECQRVVFRLAAENRELCGSACLSGYTAHSKPGKYGGLEINGAGDDACETFIMREHFNQNQSFGFCKTGRNFYDIAVVSCLAILQYRLGDAINVTSDGTSEDWENIVSYVSRKLRRKIPVPASIRPASRLRVVGE